MNSTTPHFERLTWLDIAQFRLTYKRLLLPVSLMVLLLLESTRKIVLVSLSDAFWAVASYVALTLALYHYLSRLFSGQHYLVNMYHRSRHYQVMIATLLGALPGCGGAIIVTTQFVSGRVGFGALVAVLTSTMGDAAFLLLASQPDTGLLVVAIGIVVGCLSGWAINAIHDDDFLRPKQTHQPSLDQGIHHRERHIEQTAINLQGTFWQWLLIPTTLIASMNTFQVDVNQLLALPEEGVEWIGAILIIISMLLWSVTKEINDYESTVAEDNKAKTSHPMQKAAQDTNFVTAWVIVAFIAFELLTFAANFDLSTTLANHGPWMPMMGLAIGLLPGCGPQILVTSLYLSGVVPFSAQLANAISNDGDALFPAIALAPKAALVASLYSALPALLVGYSYYFFFER